ncbi:hypothetical protein [Streptomyces sp. NPDC014894]|uniref:hypothetical protein n=1 Tax=Streptomyces sp. NPDC014894 TaxID=3364931 RepID=UPI0036FA967D
MAAAVRFPVRVAVLLVVVPVRMVWELLVPLGRAARPLGRAIGGALRFVVKLVTVWPWRYLVVPVWTFGIVRPAVWLHEHVLRYAVLVPLRWLLERVLVPAARGAFTLLVRMVVGVGRALGWTFAHLVWGPLCWVIGHVIAPPLGLLWRYVLRPVAREIVAALGLAWRITGRAARAIGAVLAPVLLPPLWWLGRLVRDRLWAPARAAARSALRTARETVEQIRRATRRRPDGPRPGKASSRARKAPPGKRTDGPDR